MFWKKSLLFRDEPFYVKGGVFLKGNHKMRHRILLAITVILGVCCVLARMIPVTIYQSTEQYASAENAFPAAEISKEKKAARIKFHTGESTVSIGFLYEYEFETEEEEDAPDYTIRYLIKDADGEVLEDLELPVSNIISGEDQATVVRFTQPLPSDQDVYLTLLVKDIGENDVITLMGSDDVEDETLSLSVLEDQEDWAVPFYFLYEYTEIYPYYLELSVLFFIFLTVLIIEREGK